MASTAADQSSSQVVFIDGDVPDLQDLLSGLAPGVEAFVLDPSSDGLQQIANLLAENNLTDVSSISIVGHGSSGQIQVGATTLDASDLSSESAALSEIGAALAPGGDLQLYACDVASGASGQQFIADLSQFAGGAEVDASSQEIGQTPTGENWTLDATADASGAAVMPPAQVSVPFTAAAEANFSGTLATPTIELWIAATGGGDQNLIIHSDNTGSGTASNVGTLFSPGSANNPTDVNPNALIDGIDLLQLDTQDGLYFIANQNNQVADAPAQILKGSLTSALANPTATPTYTSLFSTTAPDDAITGIAVDPDNAELYFEFGHDFEKVSYNGGAVTTLGSPSDGAFLDGLALDLPDHVAYFLGGGSHISTTTTLNGHIHYNDTVTSSIYEASSLSPTSGAGSVPISKLMDVPTTDGATANGVGTVGIAFDASTGRLFFTTKTIAGTGEGGVFWIDPTDPNHTIHTVFQQTGTAGTFIGNGVLQSIEVDDATGKYYVSVLGSNGEGGAIYVGNLTDSNVQPTLFETMPTFSSGTIQPGPEGFSIDNAPTLTATSLNPTFTESASNPASSNNTPVTLIASASDSDTDNDMGAGATVTISGSFSGSGDSLFALDGVTHRVSGTFAGTNITVSETTDGSGNETLTLSGTDTFAHYQTVLNDVQFTSISDNPTNYGNNTSRTISFTAYDGLLNSTAVTSTVTVVGTDDPPVNHLPATPSINEDTLATISGLTITDPDADPANQNIQVTLSVTHGTLTLNTGVANGITPGEITAGASGSNTITITATQNQINATLANATGLQYQGDANFNTGFGAENLHIVTSDLNHTGNGGPLTTTNDLSITVAAVNDPPNLQPDTTSPVSYTENATATALFAGENVDTPIADPDQSANYAGGSVDLQITTGAVTGDRISLTGSTFHISGGNIQDSGNNNIGAITGNGTSHVTISSLTTAATPSVVDALVKSFGFDSTSDDPTSAARTVTLTFKDGGNTGGTAPGLSDTVTQTVNVTAVNDPPVDHVPGSQIVNEDTALVFNTAHSNLISITDPDAESGNETVTLSVTHGTLTLGSTAGLASKNGNGTNSVTFSGTLANLNNALNGLTYQGNSNFNGSDPLTITTNDNGNTPGPAQQDQDTVAITVSAVNDAPVVINSTTAALVAINEDTASPSPAAVTINSLLSTYFSDTADDQIAVGGSAANNFAGVAVTANAATAGQGTWQYSTDNGVSWTAFPPVTATSALLLAATAEIQFIPAANFNGTPGLLTVHLVDDSSGAITTGNTANLSAVGGSTPYSSGTITISESINAVNDAPILTASGSVGFTEGSGLGVTGAAVVLDSGASVHDIELDALNGGIGNYNGATLTLSRDGGASAQDVFSGSGTLTLTSGNVKIGATTVGAFANTGGTLAITFNSNATTTLVESVLDQLTYANTSDAPPSSVQVDYTFNDGNSGSQGSGGALAATGHVTVSITPTNDAPDVTPNSPTAVTYIEGQASPVGLLSTGAVTDPDLPANFAGGDLTVAIAAGEDAGKDQIVLLGSSGFTNNAGTLMDGATAIGTDSGLGTDTVTITSLTAAATPAEVSKLLEAFAFQTSSTTAGDRAVSFTFDDGGNTGGTPPGLSDSVSQTVHVNAAPAAGAPILSVTGTATDAVEQTGPASVLTADTITTDPTEDPSGNITNATVTISGSFVGSGDTLSVLDAGGTTHVTSGALTDFPAINVSVSTDVNGNETLTLTGVDSAADYQSALAHVQFLADSDNPTDFGLHPTRTLTWSVNDGTSDSVPVSTNLTIDPVNDAPANTVPGAQSVAEDTALAFTGGNTISVSDADNTSLSVTLSANHGNVTLGSVTNLTVTGTNGSHSVTIAVLTADVDAALATLSYQGDANFNSTTPDTLTISTSDGIAAPTVSTVDITVTPVADAPTGADHAASTNVNTPYVFSASDLAFSDAADDQTGVGGSSPNNFTGVKITTLSLPSGATLKDNGTTVNAGDTILIGDITGGKLVFTPAAGAGGSNYANFTFQVEDDGSGTAPNANLDPTPNLMTINVGSGFGPTAAADSYNVLEGATASGTAGTGGTGVLHNDSGSGLTVTAVDGSPGNVNASIAGTYGELTLHDDGSFSYVADQTGAIDGVASVAHPVDTFNYTVTDNEATPLSATTTVSFSVDRDPVTATHTASVLEGASTGTVSANDTDPDGDTLTVTAPGTQNGTYGTFVINSSDTYNYTADNTASIDAVTGTHPIDTFAYSVSDGLGGITLETLNVSVDRAPSTPVDNDPANDSAGPINGSVVEGAAVNTTVGITAHSTDTDNDTVTYSLTNSAGNFFKIDSSTGVVSVDTAGASGIDFESTGPNHTYSITAQADDGHGGTSSQSFSIAVADAAPSTPADGDTGTANTVVEGAAANTYTGLTASSTDVNGGTVTYSLTNNANGAFKIDTNTGAVSVNDPTKIDFETTAPGHTLTITVQASDGTLLSSTQDFTIAVTDANPSMPTDSDNTTNGVTEGAAAGTPVNITASSSDVNGPPVTYSLTDSAGGFFTIDPTSGVVSVDTAGATGINYETAPGHAYSITVQASDGQGGVSTASFSIPVTDVAPTSVADSYTVDEDTLLNPNAAAGVLANDTDINGGPLTAVLDTGPAHDLTFALNPDGSFSYQGALNFNGSDSFTYHAFDGAQSGGTVTVNLTINPVNDPPVFASLGTGPHPQFTENGSSVILDSNVTISDVELDAIGNYAGATLTLARDGIANPDDSLVGTGTLDLADAGPGGNVSLDGGTNFIGTADIPGDGSFSITFNANATALDVDSVMQQIAYADVSDNPPASVQIDWTFSDGNGVPGGQAQGSGPTPGIATGSVTVDVTQVDDPPALLNVAVAASYGIGTSGVVLSSGLQAFDPDATPPSPNIGIHNATITITFGLLASDNLFVNLPTFGGHFITPDTGVTNISVQSDLNGQLVLSGTDSVLAYQEVLDAVSYQSSAADPTNGGADPTRTIDWQVSDGVLDNQAPSVPHYPETTLGFDAPPTIDLDSASGGTGFTATYTENEAPIAIVGADTVADPDNASLPSATITLTNAKVGDILSIAGALPFGISSFIDATVPGQITVDLTGSASLADYQSALAQINYSSSSDNPDPTDRDITFVTTDGEASSNVAHATVHVIPVNDAPVATIAPAGYTVIVQMNLSLKNAGLSVSDVDDGGGIETVTLSVGEGTLAVAAGTSGAIIDSGNDSGSVTFHGTIAQLDDLLNTNATSAITYVDETDTPAPATTLTLAINDGGNTGTGGARTGQASATITIDQPPHVANSNVDEWILTDGEWAASAQPGSIPSGYQVAGTGDFTGNGTSDILWQNPTSGDTQEWLIDNGAWAGTVDLGAHPGTGWTIAGVGDFFGNGIDDVLWTNPTSGSNGDTQVDIWELGSNGQWTASVTPGLGLHPPGYQVAAIGNFTGSGTDGVLWYDPTNGNVDEWVLDTHGQWTNSVDLGSHPGSGWTIAGVGDFFGNGRDDILWTNPNSGPGSDTEVDIWQLGSNGQWTASVSPGLGLHPPGYQVAAIGNFTGNGTDGVLWYDPTDGNVDEWVLDTNGQWAASINLGSHPGNFQIAGTGAFVNGNSTSDILWHQNS